MIWGDCKCLTSLTLRVNTQIEVGFWLVNLMNKSLSMPLRPIFPHTPATKIHIRYCRHTRTRTHIHTEIHTHTFKYTCTSYTRSIARTHYTHFYHNKQPPSISLPFGPVHICYHYTRWPTFIFLFIIVSRCAQGLCQHRLNSSEKINIILLHYPFKTHAN